MMKGSLAEGLARTSTLGSSFICIMIRKRRELCACLSPVRSPGVFGGVVWVFVITLLSLHELNN